MLKINKNSIKDLFPNEKEGVFNLITDLKPAGDQIEAINQLKDGLLNLN